MQGKYSDTELAQNQSINALGGDLRTQCRHTSFRRVRLHQATHALIGQCAAGYKDTVQANKLLAGALSSSVNSCSHWSLSWQGYKDTVLAHKLLGGAGLHQATHALREIFGH
jgi:hypothetical protein